MCGHENLGNKGVAKFPGGRSERESDPGTIAAWNVDEEDGLDKDGCHFDGFFFINKLVRNTFFFLKRNVMQ